MLADAMTSIKAYLYERAVSPLLGSLIVSWCAWNYKFLLLWVSGIEFSEKLRYIDILYSDNYGIYLQGMLFPFLTSMAYLFIFTYPAEWVYRFSLDRQKVLNKVKNDRQENELLSVEQSRAIRQQLADAEKNADDLLERKDRAIEARNREIEKLQSQVTELQSSLEEASVTLDERVEEAEREASDLTKIANRLKGEENQSDDNTFGVVTDIALDDEDTKLPQQPTYFNFYSSLNREEQSTVENIIVILLDNEVTFENLLSEVQHITPDNKIANDRYALKKIIGKMKVYDIVSTYEQGLSEIYYIAGDGKLLYRHILENSSSEPDITGSEDKDESNNVSFYFDADEHTQARYQRILEGLFLEDRGKHEFGIHSNFFDSAMVQLIYHGLVYQPNNIKKYRITEKGRSFYTKLNYMRPM